MKAVWTIRALGALLVGVFLVVLAHAETIELVTYYPTQTTGGNAGFTSLTVGTVPPGVTPATPLHVFGQDDQSSIVAFTRGPGGAGTGTISVGIGTAAPAATLHVVGGVYILGGNGDVNGDGFLTNADSLLIANFLNNPVANPLTPAQYAAADTNGDGVVDSNDVITINDALNARGGNGPPLSEAERQLYKGRNYLAATLFADANRNLGVGVQPQTRFHVAGHDDDDSVVAFTAGTGGDGTGTISVGIGTTNPAAALEVSGGGTAFDALQLTNNQNDANAASSSSLVFAYAMSQGLTTGSIVFRENGNNENNGNMIFSVPSGGVEQEAMRIAWNGNVGIGTKNPQADLEVNNTLRLTPTTAPSHAVKGALYYDDSENVLKVYDGSGWRSVGGGPRVYTAVGTTNISTGSLNWVDMPDMTITRTFPACTAYIHFNAAIRDNNAAFNAIRILVDGVVLKAMPKANMSSASWELGSDALNGYMTDLAAATPLTAGTHTISVQWKVFSQPNPVAYQDGGVSARHLVIITG